MKRRTALITGGSRGIGRAVCLEMVDLGYHILVNYQHNEEAARETMDLIHARNGSAELFPCDISDREDCKSKIESWQHKNEDAYIAVVVNNAGIRKDGLMVMMPDENWDEVIQTSLGGFYNITKPCLQDMVLNKFGRIVNMASLSGLKGNAGQVNYAAAKGGMIAAAKSLAQEVGRKNITVNVVAPGFIKTEMTEGIEEADFKKVIPLGRFGTAEEVAKTVKFLVSADASYITGEVISVNGGLYT